MRKKVHGMKTIYTKKYFDKMFLGGIKYIEEKTIFETIAILKQLIQKDTCSDRKVLSKYKNLNHLLKYF